MKKILTWGMLFIFFCLPQLFSQNIGIGTISPAEKLDVAGKIRTQGLVLTTGGNTADFLIKSNATGDAGYRKGHGAQAIRYIICLEGIYPSSSFGLSGEPFIAEIKLFAGNFAPQGWAFCDGQILSISQNTALFSLIGTQYGGNGVTTFALPDLRGAAPLGIGTSPAGYTWNWGEKSN